MTNVITDGKIRLSPAVLVDANIEYTTPYLAKLSTSDFMDSHHELPGAGRSKFGDDLHRSIDFGSGSNADFFPSLLLVSICHSRITLDLVLH